MQGAGSAVRMSKGDPGTLVAPQPRKKKELAALAIALALVALTLFLYLVYDGGFRTAPDTVGPGNTGERGDLIAPAPMLD